MLLTRLHTYGEKAKSYAYVVIIETDQDKDWRYAVWRKLYVVPLPLKID